MTSRKWNPFAPSLVGATFLASQLGMILFGHAAHKAEAKNVTDTHPEGITTQGTTSICKPIYGTGKSAGVPITVKRADGTRVTDISKYTFEMFDGTNTQDVTDLIGTAAEQPIITGQPITKPVSFTLEALGNTYRALGTTKSKTGPALSFTNPGYFFLGCTADPESDKAKFPAGTILRLKSGSTVVASVSLEGRGASNMGLGETDTSTLAAIATPLRGTKDSDDFEGVYKDVIALSGVRFRSTFATLALVQMTNSMDFGTTPVSFCIDDLISVSGSNWSWNATGQSLLNELTSTTATSFPLLAARTTGASGDPALCNLASATAEDEFFENLLAIQMLLIDGPQGKVSSTLANENDFFAPASVLQLGSVAATASSSSATVTFKPLTRPSSAKSYQYSIDGGKTWKTATVTSVSDGKLEFEIPGLSSATSYTVQIRAITLTDAEVFQGAESFTTSGKLVTVGSSSMLMSTIAVLMLAAGTATLRLRRRRA